MVRPCSLAGLWLPVCVGFAGYRGCHTRPGARASPAARSSSPVHAYSSDSMSCQGASGQAAVPSSRLAPDRMTRRAVVAALTCGHSALLARAASSDTVGRGMRATGNARNGIDIDAALGIAWGGRDRCDAADPLCGADGQRRDAPVEAASVPVVDSAVTKITTVTYLDVEIAGSPAGRITIGLYGDAGASQSASVFASLCDSGLRAGDYFLSWVKGASITLEPDVSRRVTITLSMPDQAAAYARRMNLRKPPANFERLRLPRSNEGNALSHNQAGLLSVRRGGAGDDLEYSVTLRAEPRMDRDHVVIGQLMDTQSMSLLARLGALPARNNIGNAGSPIVRFAVYDAGVLPMEEPVPGTPEPGPQGA